MAVTPAELKNIFPTTLTDPQLTAFIDAASLVVGEELAGAGHSVERLKQIELFLAAHLAHAADPRVQSESVGGEYQMRVQGQTGTRLEATHYGQQVLLLDPSGRLARAAEGLKLASLSALSEYDGVRKANS